VRGKYEFIVLDAGGFKRKTMVGRMIVSKIFIMPEIRAMNFITCNLRK